MFSLFLCQITVCLSEEKSNFAELLLTVQHSRIHVPAELGLLISQEWRQMEEGPCQYLKNVCERESFNVKYKSVQQNTPDPHNSQVTGMQKAPSKGVWFCCSCFIHLHLELGGSSGFCLA